MTVWLNQIHVGDCRQLMRQMIADGVRAQCIVTSPPYWGLRDYGVPGQFGLERTWIRHVARMRGVFRLVWDLLADDGVLWLNYGDSYHTSRLGGGIGLSSTINGKRGQEEFRKASRAMKSRIRPPDVDGPNRRRQAGLKPKDLIGMPWRIALALQSDGWYLRSDVIWHKPNPMPESMLDRPTKAHEYLFLLTKSERYHYDATAIREPSSPDSHARAARGRSSNHKWADGGPGNQTIATVSPSPGTPRVGGVTPKVKKVAGWADGQGSHSAKDHARAERGMKDSTKFGRGAGWRNKQNPSFSAAVTDLVYERNVRSVWTIPTAPFSGAHFATFPLDLVRRCILAGSREGDVVFDPFMGSGTVAQVADELGRKFIGCELNPEYAAMYGTLRAAQIGMGLG